MSTTTAQQFMEIARQIDKQLPQTEISHRAIANRAYYAAYHMAKTHCTVDKQAKAGVHEQLLRGMVKDKCPAIREAGVNLRKAKKNRVKADYKLRQKFTLHDKNQALEHEKNIIHLLT